MKKIFAVSFLVIGFIIARPALANSLCDSIDGDSIYGANSNGDWTYLGSISSPYDSNSIANKYGKGSKYDSDSIFNTYGDFGSKYSDYSAFSSYATNPPIIVDSDYNFVAYLTIEKSDDGTTVTPFAGYWCAQQSYATSSVDN